MSKTIAQAEKEKKNEDEREISENPLIKAILNEFEGVKFETILRRSELETDKDTDQNDQQESIINNFEEED